MLGKQEFKVLAVNLNFGDYGKVVLLSLIFPGIAGVEMELDYHLVGSKLKVLTEFLFKVSHVVLGSVVIVSWRLPAKFAGKEQTAEKDRLLFSLWSSTSTDIPPL